jgi:DNA-binding LacI/PurR family transcriptional regulator
MKIKLDNKKAKLEDISKVAAVSINTVAKVLAGQQKVARISDKTARKIKKIALELGYVPNVMARNLRSKRTRSIAVFVADITEATYTMISHLVLNELHKKGFLPFLTVAEIGIERCFHEWLQNRAEGVILCGTSPEMTTDFLNKILEHGIVPIIAGCTYRSPATSSLDASSFPTVSMDNSAGILLAINHLLSKEYNRIAHIPGPNWHGDAYERRIAYETIICQHHKPIVAIAEDADRFWIRGYSGAAYLYNQGLTFDALIAYDDQTAIGAIKWLVEHNQKLPDKIGIVGIDNAPEAESCSPSLTTIAQPLDIIAQKTVGLLESSLYSNMPVEKILITPTVVIRNSTRP